MKQSKRGRQIAFLFLFLLGIFWIIPIVWLIFNSFKYDSDFITSFANLKGRWDYLTRMIPRQWTGSNYTELFVGGENVNTTANIMKILNTPESAGQISAFRLLTQPSALAMRNCGRIATTFGNMLTYISVQKILLPPLKLRRS